MLPTSWPLCGTHTAARTLQRRPCSVQAQAAGGSSVPPRRRRTRPGPHSRSTRKDSKPSADASDAQLLQELNSAHQWMPGLDADSDDFGMEDVAAHVRSREEQEDPFSAGAVSAAERQSPSGAARARQRAAKALIQHATEAEPAGKGAAAGGDDDEWYDELQEAGFRLVEGRSGEVFMQRSRKQRTRPPARAPAAPAQQHSEDSRPSREAAEPSAASTAAASAAASPSAPTSKAKSAAASWTPNAPTTFHIRREFDPQFWPLNASSTLSSSSTSRSMDQDWFASPADNTPQASASAAPGSPAPQQPKPAELAAAAAAAPRRSMAAIVEQLLAYEHPTALLDYLERAFPAWATNNCRLVHMGSGQQVEAPTPAEAAWALKGAALAARRGRLSSFQRMSVSRDRRILGLVECLRVQPPRLLPGQDSSISAQAWAVAKRYWLQSAEPAAAAQAKVSSTASGGNGAGSGVNGSSGANGSGQRSTVSSSTGSSNGTMPSSPGANGATASGSIQGRSTVNGSSVNGSTPAATSSGGSIGTSSSTNAGTPAPPASSLHRAGTNGSSIPQPGSPLQPGSSLNGTSSHGLERMLSQAIVSGTQLAPPAAATAAQLLARRQQQLKQGAVVAAVWGLSVLGGASFFADETQALVQVTRLKQWHLGAGELADLLWALANARHWTARLPDVEDALLQAGGLPALRGPELAAALWAFATLGHVPGKALAGLGPEWRHQVAGRGAAAARRGGKGAGHISTVAGLSDLHPGQLASAVWSLAAMQQVEGEPFKAAWSEVCRRGSALAGQPHHLMQVWQAAMAIQLEGSYSMSSLHWDKGSEQLLAAARQAFLQQTAALRNKVHSSYQRGIANTLTSMRIMHLVEDQASGYSVDITLPEQRIAIEADGPTHLARTGNGQRQMGATAMKRRHLQALGWAVVNVTFLEWDALGTAERREAFLRQRIREALAESAAGGGSRGGGAFTRKG